MVPVHKVLKRFQARPPLRQEAGGFSSKASPPAPDFVARQRALEGAMGPGNLLEICYLLVVHGSISKGNRLKPSQSVSWFQHAKDAQIQWK